MLSEKEQEQLIQAAIYAPSADNSQPFQYQWHDNQQLALWIDAQRSGKASDNRYILSDIAMGAVIENVLITAHSLGYEAEVNYFPTARDDTTFDNELHVATLVFTPLLSPKDTELAKQIPLRCTDRRFPFKGDINQSNQQLLSNEVDLLAQGVMWFNDKKLKKQAVEVIQKAESIRFKSETLHQELFSTVHFNNPRSEEGMPIEVLAIEKPAQPFFKWMKNWRTMTWLNKVGAYAMLGIRSVKMPILFSPALALITISNNDRLSVINGGRALQRFWLKASELGIAIQPYAAPGIFSLGFVKCESQFDIELAGVGKKMATLVESGYGLMFLRIGYSKPIKHRSNRRSLGSFLKKN